MRRLVVLLAVTRIYVIAEGLELLGDIGSETAAGQDQRWREERFDEIQIAFL
jgi:hypothetical protein